MAKAITEADGTEQAPGNNGEARAEAHKRLIDSQAPIEAEIESLNTKLKQQRAKLRKVRKEWAKETNMALADFDAARRLAMIEDDDDRRDKIEDLCEIFNTLAPGETLNFLESAHYKDDAA